MTNGLIPQDIIEQVRTTVDIVEIIGEYVRLKKRGRNYMAVCPFHTEKTPSFSVSPEKQIFHCFGCGKGGNVFTFLMEHENMTFVEAVRLLADRAGIRIPERTTEGSSKEELEKLHYAHRLALEYFRSLLHSEKYRERIMHYLKEVRKINDDMIDFFQLGLAGDEWDGFLKTALKKGLFAPELIKAGLVLRSEKHDKYFDRFRQRLMIPIFNLSQKPIAFGGRALKKGDPAKYINSPETMLYTKSNVLYGLNFSRQFIREKNEVIIVEGYFDLISLYQAGIKNVVASSGTAFTAPQARLLARFADMACLFFDADSAGQNAAIRSVDALYDAGIEVMVMVPPEGEDPDSLVKAQGPEGVEELRRRARRYLEFRTQSFDVKKQGIIAREKLIKEIAELAGRIADLTRRRLFIAEAAELLNTNEQNFYHFLPQASGKKSVVSDITPPKKIVDLESDLLSLIINYPEHLDMVRDKVAPDDFQSEINGQIYSILLTADDSRDPTGISALMDMTENGRLKTAMSSLAEKDWNFPDVRLAVSDYVKKISYFKRERIIDRLKGELKLAEEKGDSDTACRLTEEITELIKRRQE